MTAFDRIIGAAQAKGRTVKQNGHGKAMVQCPAHDDTNPSLSVTAIEGSVLLYCHAGCDIAEILAALGLGKADLYDNRNGARYDYPGGRQVHRTPNKDFYQKGNTKSRDLFRADRIGDATTVYWVEGEKDVLAVESAGGVAVCNAMGAGKAHLADRSVLQGKDVVVVADKDDPGREHARQVAELLNGTAKSVRIVEPALGKDVAVHIAAGHSLDELVSVDWWPESPNGAEPDDAAPEPDDNDTGEGLAPIHGLPSDHYGDERLIDPPSAPLPVAETIYDDFKKAGTGLWTLRAWRAGWMIWRTTHWTELDGAQLRSHVYRVLSRARYEHVTTKIVEVLPWNPGRHKVANVVDALAALALLPPEIDPPAWIGSLHSAASDDDVVPQLISFTNGLLDLETRKLSDHTPAWFNVVSVPFAYDPNPGKPVAWLEFLESVWGDDQASIMLLQEYIGYLLSGRTHMQKMLLLVGPTRSGKGTIGRLLRRLLGRGHVTGPTLASLGTNFGMSPLLGKPLAIVSDARLGKESSVVVERLLSITGEDTLTVDRKYREAWTGKLPTRFVILTNELPRFRDAAGAIANRMLILQLTESFLGREDHELDAKIAHELPAILSWALEGLDRLLHNDRFTVPASSVDATTLMMDLASPVSAFVRERCARDANGGVLVDDLYAAWKDWAENNGHRVGAKSTFGRDLRAVVPELQIAQPRINGAQVRRYERIGLKSWNLNTDQPVSPVSGHDVSRGAAADTGYPVSGGHAKPLVNDTDTGDTGRSALKVQHRDSMTGDLDANDGRPLPAEFIVEHIRRHGDEKGEALASKVIAAGLEAGYTERQLINARHTAESRIYSRRATRRFDDPGMRDRWLWGLGENPNGSGVPDEASEGTVEDLPDQDLKVPGRDLAKRSVAAAPASTGANAAYRDGLCIEGCGRRHSPGRPRCEEHHAVYVRVMAGYDR